MAGHRFRSWYKRNPSAFLAGTRGMRPILHKTYTRLVDGYYEYGGPLPDDPRRLKSLLELRVQDVPRILDELVAMGKIRVEGGLIHNKRADVELAEIAEMDAQWASTERSMEAEWSANGTQVEPKSKPIRGKKRKKNYARASDPPQDRPHSRPEADTEGNKALPQEAESFITNALPIEVGSLRPAANGLAEGSALNGSPGPEGRSPAEPSERVEVPIMRHSDIRSEPFQPTPELLKSKLVAKPLSGLMAASHVEEDDDADET